MNGQNRWFRGIHGLVAQRLLLAWMVLSLIVGGTVIYLDLRKIDALSFGLARSASESLRTHMTEVGAQHLDSLTDAIAPLLTQNYLHVRVLDKAGKVIVEATAPHPAPWMARLTRMDSDVGVLTADRHQTLWLDGELIVHVSMPLTDRSGRMIGTFQGAYRVDDATRQQAQASLRSNVLLVLLAILVTALTLYPVILGLNRGVMQLSAKLLRSNIELMEVVGSAIAKRDSDTDLHNYRVCLYSIRFAEILGLSKGDIRTVITGAFLHDVGKIGISDAILLKPGKLTFGEFESMKKHVQLGTDIVAKSSWLAGARDVIEFHHEKFDGSGYMTGLKGEAIPLAARLFAIVDVFDALTSRRPYKAPLSMEEAMRILIESRGSHFDPPLLDVFAKSITHLYSDIAGLDQAGLQDRLRDHVENYFFEGHDDGSTSSCPSWLAEFRAKWPLEGTRQKP